MNQTQETTEGKNADLDEAVVVKTGCPPVLLQTADRRRDMSVAGCRRDDTLLQQCSSRWEEFLHSVVGVRSFFF